MKALEGIALTLLADPLFWSLVLWPAFTALLSLGYGWLEPRAPGLVAWLRRYGCDASGLTERAKKLAARRFPAAGGGLMLLLVLGAAHQCGCAAHQLEPVVAETNATRDFAADAREVIDEVCVPAYKVVRTPEQFAAVDKVCAPASKAYETLKAAWGAQVAAVQVALLSGRGLTPEILAAGARLFDATKQLAAALAALRDGAR